MKLQRRPIVFCLVGPAGSGKTSLAKRLLEDPSVGLKKSVSTTSRAPRPGEVQGVNYFFVTGSEFQSAVSRGEFFEWEEIHGNYYGQTKSSLESNLATNSDVLLDIDIRGAASVEQKFPNDTVVIFLLPPSKEALKSRIVARAPISDEELAKRLVTAEAELNSFMKAATSGELIDYCLVNADFEDTLKGLKSIVETERKRLSRFDSPSLKSLIG